MILYEYEGKQLLQQANLATPQSLLVRDTKDLSSLKLAFPIVLKAQVLSGKRAQAGGIIIVNSYSELEPNLKQLLGQTINSETVTSVLIEEKVEIKKEYYFSLTYDTDYRSPIITFSQSGGTGIEQKSAQKIHLDILNPNAHIPPIPHQITKNLVDLFFKQDCLLLEINPLVQTTSGEWVCLDAKVKLDDNAILKHPEWNYPPRSVPGHLPTEREIAAKKIDEGDYRGTAGSAYFDLEGDIAILASGGGASLTAMDALISAGGKPANYTEYSGNPPKEKVLKLAEIVLSKPNLSGLWIVGAIANFTDIYETLSGIVQALRQIQSKPQFPIVIRRGGPRDQEAFAMLKTITDFDLHVYGEETSITESAKVMAELADKYHRQLISN